MKTIMKKILFTFGIVLALACSSASIMNARTGSRILVAYFTWPEPDGVDASSGASRVIIDGQQGNHRRTALYADISSGSMPAMAVIRGQKAMRRLFMSRLPLEVTLEDLDNASLHSQV